MSTTYAKLTEAGTLDILYRVPHVTNASPEMMAKYAKENGYLPVEYTNSPGEWYSSSWSKQRSKIVEVWKEWDVDMKVPTIQTCVQQLLDSTAAERNYDNIFTALTYLDSKNPKFAAEAAALRDWRDAMWTKCYEYLAKVEAGEIVIPDNWEAVKAELPSFEWPSL